MDKAPRTLKLPNAAHGGVMESIIVDNIIAMETPKETTLVDDITGEIYEIDVEKHTLVFEKSFKKSGNYEYYIPLTLKEMILLINSDASYSY